MSEHAPIDDRVGNSTRAVFGVMAQAVEEAAAEGVRAYVESHQPDGAPAFNHTAVRVALWEGIYRALSPEAINMAATIAIGSYMSKKASEE